MILEGTAYGRPRPTYDPLITEVGPEHRAANISALLASRPGVAKVTGGRAKFACG